MYGVKTSSLYRAALRFPWMCTSWVFRRRIWHPTSSHFLRRNCRPQGTVPCELLIPASVDTCTAISFLQHESWFIAEPDSPPVLQVPAPYSVAPSYPCKSLPTSQYCANVRTSGRFHGDGFWLSVPIFVGDLGHLMPQKLQPENTILKLNYNSKTTPRKHNTETE